MERLEYQFGEHIIEFLFQDDLMVNATEMAAAYGKRSVDFLKNPSTQKLISALEKTSIRANRSENFSLRFAGNEGLGGETKHRSADLVPLLIVQKGGEEGGATWMHRYLAIDFAMWLDIDFKIWILRKIDELLLSYTSEKRLLALRKRQNKENINKIISSSENEEVKELAKLIKERDQIKGEEFNLNKNFNRNLFNQ